MRSSLSILALAMALPAMAAAMAPQGPVQRGEPLFVPKGSDPVLLSADRTVTAAGALNELAETMNWTVIFQPRHLLNDLGMVSLDLALVDQDPRLIAQLLANAGGADVVFDEGSLHADHTTMHVIPVPDEYSDEGRQRLRARASQWYQNFLIDELRRDPTLEEDAMQVRMHLGQLLRDSGDLDGAIRFYGQIREEDPIHELAVSASLKVAECYFELGDYDRAERWTKIVLDRSGMPPEKPLATILLGRILLATDRVDECITQLESRILRLDRRRAVLDAYLVLGEAHLELAQSDRVYQRMLTLARAIEDWPELSPEQWLDYHFLRGYGAAGTNRPAEAIEFLERFLIRADDHPRRGHAFVLLSQAYLDNKQYLEARAAAIEATGTYMATMDPLWRRQARKLLARSSLALGDKDSAFDELEREVIQHRDPELSLFLIDEFMADQRWQRAINTARPLTEREDAIADQARVRMARAMFQQARNARSWGGFAAEVKQLVLAMQDPPLRVEVMELLAAAYEGMGDTERAADVIRGVLR